MVDFHKMAERFFDHTHINWEIFYNRVVNWGTYNAEDFKKVDVGNPEHPEYNYLLEEYSKLPPANNIRHNLTL